jgi:hypothetical protein
MHIPLRWYEAIVRGSAVRAVACENCQTEFVYILRRQGLGHGVSPLYLDNQGAQDRARAHANADLHKELTRGQDPVPCPECGWYQRSMIPLLRQAHRRGMMIGGAFFQYVAALFFVLTAAAWFRGDAGIKDWVQPCAQTSGGLANIGLGLILTRKLLARRIRPNEGDPEARKALGQELAMKKEDFNRALQAAEERLA